MNKITKTLLPCLVISLLAVGCVGYNANASVLSDEIFDRVADKIAERLLGDLESPVIETVIEEEEAQLGWSTRDEIHLNNDSGVVYLGQDKDVGIRISSGVLQCKNTTAGSWGACAGGTPGDEGWLADAINNSMHPATNSGGDLYPVILGTDATTTPANSTTELYVGGGGGIVATGELDVAGAVELNGGAFTFNEDGADLNVRFESDDDAQALVIDGGDDMVGIGVVDPGAKLEVLSATAQLWLSYDGSNATTFTVSSGGDLTIVPSGADLAITGDLTVSATTTATTGFVVATDTLIVDGSAETVGINVADPDYALEILDTTAPLKLSYDGSNSCAFVVSSAGDGTYTCSGGDISFVNENLLTTGNFGAANITGSGVLAIDTDTIYTDTTNNSVGIGTTTPNSGGASFAVNDELEVYDDTSPYDLLVELKDSAVDVDSGVINVYENNTVTAKISGATGEDTYFDTSLLFIDGSANVVGIATATPSSSYPLDVYGDFRVGYAAADNTLIVDASAGFVSIGTSTLDIALTVEGDLEVAEAGAASSALTVNGGTMAVTMGGALSVTGVSTLTDDLVVDTDTLYVDNSADAVGISSSTPTADLAIGTANATSSIHMGYLCISATQEDGSHYYIRLDPTQTNVFATSTTACE